MPRPGMPDVRQAEGEVRAEGGRLPAFDPDLVPATCHQDAKLCDAEKLAGQIGHSGIYRSIDPF